MKQKSIAEYKKDGVEFIDEKDVYIGPNVIIGEGTVIWPNVTITKGTTIHKNVTILPNSIIDNSVIDDNCNIGPNAYIHNESHIFKDSTIGAFVEVNRSTVGERTSIKHLSYIGDGKIGHDCNIGAGVVFANYDGLDKHATFIDDEVFVGSNVVLVAPVKVETGAKIGAGTTVLKNVLKDQVVVNETKMRVLESKKKK